MSEQQVWTDDEFVSELSEHSAAHKNDWNAALELGRKMLKAWQADHDDLTAQLTDMTNSQHVNERSLDEYARTIARLRAQLTDIKRNGYIPARDTVGGVISSEWDTPEEDAAWAHLEEGGNDE